MASASQLAARPSPWASLLEDGAYLEQWATAAILSREKRVPRTL